MTTPLPTARCCLCDETVSRHIHKDVETPTTVDAELGVLKDFLEEMVVASEKGLVIDPEFLFRVRETIGRPKKKLRIVDVHAGLLRDAIKLAEEFYDQIGGPGDTDPRMDALRKRAGMDPR